MLELSFIPYIILTFLVIGPFHVYDPDLLEFICIFAFY